MRHLRGSASNVTLDYTSCPVPSPDSQGEDDRDNACDDQNPAQRVFVDPRHIDLNYPGQQDQSNYPKHNASSDTHCPSLSLVDVWGQRAAASSSEEYPARHLCMRKQAAPEPAGPTTRRSELAQGIGELLAAFGLEQNRGSRRPRRRIGRAVTRTAHGVTNGHPPRQKDERP